MAVGRNLDRALFLSSQQGDDMAAKSRVRENSAYFLVAPMVLGLLVFAYYPVVASLVASFFEIDVPNGRFVFAQFQNYGKILMAESFQRVLLNSFLYVATLVSFSLVVGVLLAVWLKRPQKRYDLALSVIFLPHVISLVSVALLWMWLFEPDAGLINYLMSLFGLPKLLWLLSPDTSLLSVIIVGLWKVLGYNTLILVAGLQAVPAEYYEAARVDGCGRMRTLLRITIPLLSPSLFFVLITTLISSFGVFDSVAVMTQGRPFNSSNVLAYWIYQTGFKYFRLGEAMAGSVILITIVGVVALFNFRFLSKKVHYQ